jgi:hypothetical protein
VLKDATTLPFVNELTCDFWNYVDDKLVPGSAAVPGGELPKPEHWKKQPHAKGRVGFFQKTTFQKLPSNGAPVFLLKNCFDLSFAAFAPVA